MSPLQLSICLHYHTSPGDAPWIKDHPHLPLQSSIVTQFVDDGLLEVVHEGERMYNPTAKLHAFVKLLSQTPLPEQAFVDPRTEQVIK
jgi:hypothetical protein